MSNQNSNKNKKFIFNAVDALIILVTIVLIALIVYVFALGNDLSSCNQESATTDTSSDTGAQTQESINEATRIMPLIVDDYSAKL